MEKIKSKIDNAVLLISSGMLAVMMIILLVNIILRYMPGFGGFKWYMESSQYLNVWAMFIVGISISLDNSHLNVGILEDNVSRGAQKIIKVIKTVFIILFYIGVAYGAYLLATKSKQVISTMPYFKMSYVYWLIPISSILSAISAGIGCIYDLRNIDQMKGGREE